VKKETAIHYTHERGFRLCSVDSAAEVKKVARAAPEAEIWRRFTVHTTGAQWPISREFRCSEEDAVGLLRKSVELGLGLLNLGGGLPRRYEDTVPALDSYFGALDNAVAGHFPKRPALIRYLPGDAGKVRSEVVR
jgi:ornithine decarboxylase